MKVPGCGSAPTERPQTARPPRTKFTHSTSECFHVWFFRPATIVQATGWGFLGQSLPSTIHKVGVSGKAGGGFWESGWGFLGKSKFANPLKTKGYLAFSASFILI